MKVASAVAVLLLAAPFSVEAQQAKQIPRIGFLASSSEEQYKSRLSALEQGLRELGYVEGKDIVVEFRSARGRFEVLPALAAELVRLNLDVLVTEGTPAARAAKNATRHVPIVMGNAGDPVGTGLVASLARPGGNITGLSDFSSDLVAKRLELLKEFVPSLSRVAVLWNPGNPTNPLELRTIQMAAPALGVAVLPYAVSGRSDIEHAFAAMRKERPAGLMVAGDPMIGSQAGLITELALQSRLPAILGVAAVVNSAGLIGYGTNFDELFRRAATYVDKVLKGAKPADLPIEQPTKFTLAINMKTAKALGLTIPQSLLLRADRVIE